MTSGGACPADAHAWRELGGEEVAALRSRVRRARPPGAWVEGAAQCERCGCTEVTVSWFGKVERVPFAPAEGAGGEPVVQWPAR